MLQLNIKLIKQCTIYSILCLVVLSCAVGDINTSNWQNVGQPGFSNTSISFPKLAINNGTPYVAYTDLSSGKIIVMKFSNGNSGTWEPVGPQSLLDKTGLLPQIAISNNVPYIAYAESVVGGKIIVMKFENNTWVNVGHSGIAATDGNTPSLAISNGTPYVAYVDYTQGRKMTVKKLENNQWVNVGNPGLTEQPTFFPQLAISNNIPYVAYEDNAHGGKATVMKFENNKWINVGNPGFSAGSANLPQLTIINKVPYVAYEDNAHGGKATVMKFENNKWVNVGNPGFSLGKATEPSLSNINKNPVIAFRDDARSNRATVMTFVNNKWTNIGDPGFSAGAIDSPSLAIINNTPYVAYVDNHYQSFTTVMHYTPNLFLTAESYIVPSNQQIKLTATVLNKVGSPLQVTFKSESGAAMFKDIKTDAESTTCTIAKESTTCQMLYSNTTAQEITDTVTISATGYANSDQQITILPPVSTELNLTAESHTIVSMFPTTLTASIPEKATSNITVNFASSNGQNAIFVNPNTQESTTVCTIVKESSACQLLYSNATSTPTGPQFTDTITISATGRTESSTQITVLPPPFPPVGNNISLNASATTIMPTGQVCFAATTGGSGFPSGTIVNFAFTQQQSGSPTLVNNPDCSNSLCSAIKKAGDICAIYTAGNLTGSVDKVEATATGYTKDPAPGANPREIVVF